MDLHVSFFILPQYNRDVFGSLGRFEKVAFPPPHSTRGSLIQLGEVLCVR